MDLSYILDDLNDAQRDAVTVNDSHALILAGAGSGKTRVLIHRIAWLIKVMNFSAYNILAVTFTNKASNEMRSRLDQLVGTDAQTVTMGTFHGIAYKLLRTHYKEAGLAQNFQILDADDQKRLVKRLLKSLELDENQWQYKQVIAFINAEKEEGRRSHHIDAGNSGYLLTMLQIYQAYEEQCQRSGLVDFAELLLRAHELWLNNPQVLNHYQNRYRHILVDEFQDTNSLQYAWLRVLAGATGKLFIVGDDDQSIYGWRGAKIENVRKFEKDFINVKIIKLEQNYRSTNTILTAANQLIANNTERMGKNLWSAGEQGSLIDIYEAFNELDEATYLCNQIEAWIEQGGNREEIAVLYRSNSLSRVIEHALLDAKIPYRIYGGLRFYDRAEIRDVLAYLRLLVNRNDDAAFERVYNHPPRGIGNKTANMIRIEAKTNKISLWQAANNLIKTGLTPRATTSVNSFMSLIEALDKQSINLDLQDIVIKIISRSGLQTHFEKDNSEQGLGRLENIDELINAASSFKPTQSWQAVNEVIDEVVNESGIDFIDAAFENPLSEFLAQAALEAGEQQAEQSEHPVQLMTLHAAKGLEFSLVFMIGLEEGVFPSQQSQEDANKIEEERRLAYVGVTRAKQKLVISYANRRRLYGKEFYPQKSRFLKELPNSCLNIIRHTNNTASFVANNLAFKAPVNESGYAIGSQVFHQKFGEGTVLASAGEADNAQIQIHFKHAGSKWLVVGFANLEKI